MRIPKYCVCISPRILTTDPRPRLQADAVWDQLLVRDSLSDHFPTGPSHSRVSNPSECGWDTEVQLTAAAAEHRQSRGDRARTIASAHCAWQVSLPSAEPELMIRVSLRLRIFRHEPSAHAAKSLRPRMRLHPHISGP